MTKKEIEQLKKNRIGETKQMNCGQLATIIEYFNSNNITVKFEDNTIVYDRSYYHFSLGEIMNPNYHNKFLGIKMQMNCGMYCKIIKFSYCDDIDVEFEDGTVIKHTTHYKFLNRQINNPNVIREYDKKTDLTGEKIGKLYIVGFDHKKKRENSQDDYYYLCKCECGKHIVMESNYLKSCKKNNVVCSCGCAKSEARAKLKSIKEECSYLIPYFKNKEDLKLSIKSNKKVELKCPECGYFERATVSHITSRGYTCKMCGNINISYPERIIRDVLTQLNVPFEMQKRFSWSNNKIYDFYIASISCLIETNGKQHYEEHTWKNSRGLKKEKENDIIKQNVALKNGINKYIVIDCRNSDLNFIKNQILNSELSEIFDLSKINWEQCFYNVGRPMLNEVCRIYNDLKIKSVTEMINITNLSRRMIKECLILGDEMGLCNYLKDVQTLSHLDTNRKMVCCIEIDMQFNSMTECCKYMNKELSVPVTISIISKLCNGKRASGNFMGYHFQYI